MLRTFIGLQLNERAFFIIYPFLYESKNKIREFKEKRFIMS